MSVLALSAFQIGAAHADALTDLRATLQKLESNTPIKGVLDVQSSKLDGKQAQPKTPPAHLQLNIQAADDLSMHLGAALLQQVATEKTAQASDPDQPAPTADLLSNVGITQIEQVVSAAPMLLLSLNGASAPVIKPAVLNGAPVQELSVNLPLQASKKDKSSVKDYQGKMQIWLNAQGVPLAYQQTMHAKGCMLFLCVTVGGNHAGSLQVINGRLVAVSMSVEHKQSGLGQDSDTRTDYTLQLQQ